MLQADQRRDPENREYQRAYPVCLAAKASVLLSMQRQLPARIAAQESLAELNRLIGVAGAQSDWPVQRALSSLRLAEIEQAAGDCAAAQSAIGQFDRLPQEHQGSILRTHKVRRQLLNARCAMQQRNNQAAHAAYQAAVENLGPIDERSSVQMLALAAVLALETAQVTEQDRLLSILRNTGYRGSFVTSACQKAGRPQCLESG